jgi:tetratricopeptide (TPR) repeat protein
MADIFISYARSTESYVRAFAEVLERQGRTVWYDTRLPAHRAYADVIQEQLDAAGAALIIWSSEAVRSHWVRSEADRARLNGTLVQVRVDDCALPMPFDQIQCPSVNGWDGDPKALALKAVLESIAELLSANRRRTLLSDDQSSSHSLPKPKPERSPAVQTLFEAAMKALQSGRPSEHAQAVPLLVEATELAPEDGELWGLLAVLYAARRLEVPASERSGVESRARSAIKTALRLAPQDARAACAEVILIPTYRNWQAKEEMARSVLAQHPNHPLATFSLAGTLASAGRWREAADAAAGISRTRFLLPEVERFTVLALWAAGDLIQADLAASRGARRWPLNAGIWESQVMLFTHSGRSQEALELLNDRSRLTEVSHLRVDAAASVVSALAEPSAQAEAVRLNLAAAEQGAIDPLIAAQRLAALGSADQCFSLLEGYYFGRGPWAAASQDRGDVRSTAELFMPTMEKIWPDQRFARLTDEIGLGDYWSLTGCGADPSVRPTSG